MEDADESPYLDLQSALPFLCLLDTSLETISKLAVMTELSNPIKKLGRKRIRCITFNHQSHMTSLT